MRSQMPEQYQDPEVAVLPTGDVLRRFGLGTARGEPVEAARGAMGRVFRVETSTGVWAVKELFGHGKAAAGEELERQAALVEAAMRAGVGAPRIVRTVDGGIVAEIEGVRWRVFEWVEIVGTPSLREAGATLARLHAAGWPTTEEVDSWYTRRTVGGTWEELLERAKGQLWAPLLREQIPELEALDAIPAGAALPPCRMCHRDFNEANVALDRAGRVVVLDWDNAGPLPPEWEVGYVLANGGRGQWRTGREEGVRELVIGYQEAGGVFEPKGLEVFSMVIAAHHNFLAEKIPTAVAGDAWAREAVESMVAHPLNFAFLRRVLEAVT